MKKKPKPPSYTRALVIANIGDEFDFFCRRSDNYTDLIYEYNVLSERALFWSTASDLLVVSPLAIPEDYVQWVAKVFKKRIKVVNPQDSAQPIFEFLSEKKQVEDLKKWMGADSNTPVSLVTYSATDRLSEYIQFLTTQGISLEQDNIPTEAFRGKHRFYSSKLGFKSVLESLNDNGHAILSTAYTACDNLDAAYDAIIGLLSSGKDALLKPSDGNSGLGSLRFYTADLTDPAKIRTALQKDAFIRGYQIIVEELLRSKSGGVLESPSVELFVPPTPQKPTLLYWSKQFIAPDGGFKGLIMDHMINEKGMLRQAEKDALAIACFLQKEGFRGNFDVDFLVRDDGRFVPIETNLRRTGGTHVYGAMQSLLGEKMDNYVVVSREEFGAGITKTWSSVNTKLHDLFISRDKKYGLLPININMININYLGFVVIERNMEKALRLQDEIQFRLANDFPIRKVQRFSKNLYRQTGASAGA